MEASAMKTTVRSIFILVFLVMSTACLALADFGRGANSDDPSYPEDTEYAKSAVDGQRSQIYDLGLELERQATALAKESFEHFRGWNGTISDEEQAILFKSEAFAASCRLFLKLTEAQSDFFRSDYLRTNLSNAFTYLANAFNELEQEMRRGNVMPYVLSDCRKILTRLEREFASWPDADNLAYLDHKYVKARDAAVYLIERTGIGQYIRRPFKNLESVFRYNYDRKQDKNPWKYLVDVSYETLDKMRKGPMIDLTFEGLMILEQSNRKDRGVYLIENHKKRALTRAELVQKFGGWGKAFEVPREVIDGYEDGEPIR
jgi:hypothetical protein